MPERGAFPGADGGPIDPTRLAYVRLDRFVAQRLSPAQEVETRPVDIAAWRVGGEPVPFSTASGAEYDPFAIGERWGTPWDTVWFRVRGRVPTTWRSSGLDVELRVDLGVLNDFAGFQAEGLVYRPDGSIVKGIHPMNGWVPIEVPDGEFELLIEAAANPDIASAFDFRPTPLGDPATAGSAELYRLRRMELVLVDPEVRALEADLAALGGLALELPAGSARRAEILWTLERAIDAIDPEDVRATVPAARAITAVSLGKRASASAHRMFAVGHAHIDTAWLWPTRETVRKVARTFANVLDLIARTDEFVFAASSAQQYAWLAEAQPELFERLRAAVREGRFVPVGGMWVESDTNLPSGESFARQLVAGKRFFLEHFDVDSEEVWLPDSFGYSAALPQIIRAAGARWFLTQKISWNDTNRMPHHSFLWEGIDGSRVFTHFPPNDTYNSDLSAGELALAERQFAERGRANTSLALFGWGDGGGGPTREMLAAAERTRDLEGSPRVQLADPRVFFATAEEEYTDPPVWVGELYLELHRGVYTSQARLKRGNRRSEALLREAELWSTTAAVREGRAYPAEQLDRLWKTVLLHQFHDILPGSSIAWVNQHAEAAYEEVSVEAEVLIAAAIASLAGEGEALLRFNAGPYPQAGSPALGATVDHDGALEYARIEPVEDGYLLQSVGVRARLNSRGLLVSLVDLRSGRELIRPHAPALRFQLFRDTPKQWDAWDIDRDDQRIVRHLDEVERAALSEDGTALTVVRSTGSSTITEIIRMHSETGALELDLAIDWHEREKLLKIAFPVDLRADRATSEVQYGHVHRPVHENTSWDQAKFETVAHRWIHVGEPGLGIAIANDVAYGHDVRAHTDETGRPIVIPRVSLLRAPRFPDPDADQGAHDFRLSLRVVDQLGEAIDEGYRIHLPVRRVMGSRPVEPLIVVEHPAVVVEAVKLADDGSGDVIVRMYESRGAYAVSRIRTSFSWETVQEVDLLERQVPSSRLRTVPGDSPEVSLPAFTLCTLRFHRGTAS